MSTKLTGYVVVEIDGDEQQIEAQSFLEEHTGLWRYYGDGYTLTVTANLESAVDDEGNYPTFVEEPEVDGPYSVEIVEAELGAARGDAFEIDEDAEDEEEEDVDEDRDGD